MYKVILNSFEWNEQPVKLINFPLKKVASESYEFLSSLKPSENSFYVLVIALGAGEYWGANKNGDYFPEAELVKSYKTFESGHAFLQHQNNDPKKAVGRVVKAFWNDKMKRVELVLELNRAKAKDILERLERGETIDVSMGCKVEYDICSICGHKSRTRSEYCEHLMFHMGEILPDGKQVYAINPNPVFFDISFVRKGADPTAKVLEKVATQKTSNIEKNVPAEKIILVNELKPSQDEIKRLEELFWSSPDIPDSILEKLQSKPLGDVICTLTLLNIQLKPHELVKLLGPGVYMKPEVLFKAMIGNPDEDIMKIVQPILVKRSLHLIEPNSLDKTANYQDSDNLLYDVYRESMWHNMVKTAFSDDKVFLGMLWFTLAQLIRKLILKAVTKERPTQERVFQSELSAWRSQILPSAHPYYKFAFHKTVLVPGYWYYIAEKLIQGGKKA